MYRLAKCLAAILCAACLLTAAGASAGAERSPRIVLMCCYQQEGWGDGSSATFLDEAGCIWRYESAEPLPDTDSARLALLAEAESVVAAGQIELWRMLELISLIEAVQPGPLEPQAAVAADYGLNTFSAVRYGADGSAEVIPLAISGDQVAENLEPNAYALYVALFYEVMSHDAAEPSWLQPRNVPREPLAAFCGLDEAAFEGATLAVSYCDPQSGEREFALDADEMRDKLDWLAGLVVTVKQNALPCAGHTCAYTLYSPQGERLATFEFFDELLVTDVGMYQVEPGDSPAQ